ncbi:hypothetical protein H6P81_000418 [Aristolochia fimbriata]|uniref:FAD-binding domain-containing protein n=1 Tax=Aristolochia fimbriata TaxID=158543 RepID=A0AAV7F418_ARIFI|nr:hypothetical protein H6P81_000418 [Aristolochia fimbriata]
MKTYMALAPNLQSLFPFTSPSNSSRIRDLCGKDLRSLSCSPSVFRRGQILCAKRTGKRRYPSEKKKLERQQSTVLTTEIKNREEGYWRLSKLSVPVDMDPGKDVLCISDGLLQAIAKVLEFPVASMLPPEAFFIVRKSFDARKSLKEPKFVYTVDMDVKKLLNMEPRTWDFILKLEPRLGLREYLPHRKTSSDVITIINDNNQIKGYTGSTGDGHAISSETIHKVAFPKKPKIAVVGSGPSGLFASLVLGELGAEVTLIERGQGVEQRGRDIGSLVVRRILQPESNFCFGEGGAGTWSDGKLVTRIGRNTESVQAIMKTLVYFGAPPSILVDGKPHLGTDRLVSLLRNFRRHLQGLGVDIKFGTKLDDLLMENSRVVGIKTSDNHKLAYDAVVLAVGHSARDVYQMLHRHGVELVPKDFAVGLRIEHPQELINSIQYADLASEVCRGRGRLPVADYKVVKYVDDKDFGPSTSYGDTSRSCYSFCMCPGGQVVLTSTNPSEICINGMSFSRRASKWANAAIVVTVSSKEFKDFQHFGPLAGVEFQREFEKRAATMGGGNFVVPVQTVTDFLENKLTVMDVPQSSYRLGVKASSLHQLFPFHITQALQQSITTFDKELPGFISKDALLHGVETRTSSPLQIPRDKETFESLSLKGLYPIGEGAGYAGGILSAAVDGLYSGFAVAKALNLYHDDIDLVLGKVQKSTGLVKY